MEINRAKAEVENCLKIVNVTQEDVQKQVTEVETVKSEIESVKTTYAEKLRDDRSNARNEASSSDSATAGSGGAWQPASRGRRQQTRAQQNRGNTPISIGSKPGVHIMALDQKVQVV